MENVNREVIKFKQELKGMLSFLNEKPEEEFDSLVVSNKWQNEEVPSSFFIFKLSRNGMQMTERSKSEKVDYVFSFKSCLLTMNGEAKDQFFVLDFFKKVEKVFSCLGQEKASLYFKKKGE